MSPGSFRMFSNDEIVEIRRLSATLTQGQIAARFGVTREAINQIVNGKRYRKWNWPKFFASLAKSVTQPTTRGLTTGKKNRDELRAKAERGEPLFDESDYPTGPAATKFGIHEADLFSVRRAGVDPE